MNPRDAKPFDAPWQAQAFALAVAMADAGHFTWTEWSQALGARLNSTNAASDGSDYYDHWLENLVALASEKGLAVPTNIDETALAWQRAAAATPHGKPISLDNDPLG